MRDVNRQCQLLPSQYSTKFQSRSSKGSKKNSNSDSAYLNIEIVTYFLFLLQAAKMANYCKFQKLCDFLFLSFAIIFIITRLGIYPLWILNTIFFELPEIVGGFPGLSIFIIFLLILQILHCFWSYLIIKAAYKAVLKGKVRSMGMFFS
uniref:TLC domain-containing protein n=1 Tax=Micrurus spixii TaxID=129469 RepID=A0A2D4M4Y5_9SAUR